MSTPFSFSGFNPESEAPMQDFAPLPPGEYLLQVENAEHKTTKAGDGWYSLYVLVVLDGPAKGRKVFRRMNLGSSSQAAVDIAKREYAAFCRATGVMAAQGETDFIGKLCVASLGVKKNKEGMEEQTVREYKPASGGVTAPAHPAAARPTAPAAPAASATSPWAKGAKAAA